tara:strand:+ start:336 stop:560 length:225 start_codon:yes stop_codon:yes gene_type:complete
MYFESENNSGENSAYKSYQWHVIELLIGANLSLRDRNGNQKHVDTDLISINILFQRKKADGIPSALNYYLVYSY